MFDAVFDFYVVLIFFRKELINIFSSQLKVNSRTDYALYLLIATGQ